jgi:thioredoxin reductase
MLDAAIIGAGPYGLSIAAHLRRSGISFRIFGKAMQSWREHMPRGMNLKSDGFASNLYDPDGAFTLQNFCAEQDIAYHPMEIPVRLETFIKYGLAFRERMVPNLEEKTVTSVERLPEGFLLRLDSGEEVCARRVVLAVGITHFKYVPEMFSHLGPEYVSHSYEHNDLGPLRGRKVVVIGGGASAIELAGLLCEAGVEAQLVARRPSLIFHNPPTRRPLWQRIRHPQSGLGPGMKSRFFADWASLFYYLPERLRLRLVRRTLGPAAGWSSRTRVVGQVPMLLGMAPERAEVVEGKVQLTLRGADGNTRELVADHVITGTGYKVDMERLQFLSPEIRRNVVLAGSSPVLSPDFESSVPGLYFVGLAAANAFGPVLRFAFGAGFAARRVNRALMRSASRKVPAAAVVEAAASARTEGTTTR